MRKPLPYRGVIFDLDGTLIDHFRVIYRCYVHAMRHLGREPASFEHVKGSVGGSIVITMRKLVEEAVAEEAIAVFREEFERIWAEDVEVLPGVEATLRDLRAAGVRLACLTNKDGPRARDLLALVKLDRYLETTVGFGDTPWRKPAPEVGRHTLAVMGLGPEEACLVGDSPYDAETARACGISGYLVATGSHTEAQLREEGRGQPVYGDMGAWAQAIFGLGARDQ